MGLIHFKDEDFNEIIGKGVVVVDFYANWCGPCKMLAPIIEDLAKELDDVSFVKINVDENDELAREYSIMSIPTLIFSKDGKLINKHIGLINADRIKSIIDEN